MAISHRLIVAISVLALVAACSSGSGTLKAPATPTSRVEVSLTDALKMAPEAVAVQAGVPVTFVVTNRGAVEHEFFVGDEATQTDHERLMNSMPGMMHDGPEGMALQPGQTKQLLYTFKKAGLVLAACHEAGHYGAGMKLAITVAG